MKTADPKALPLPPSWEVALKKQKSGYLYLHLPHFTDYLLRMASPPHDGLFLYCYTAGGHTLREGHHSLLVRPDFLSMRLILKGNEYVRYDGTLYLAEPGDLMFFRPFHNFEYATGPAGFCTSCSLTFRGTCLESLVAHSNLAGRCDVKLDDTRFFLDAFEQFKTLFASETLVDHSINAGLAFRFLQQVSDHCAARRIPKALQEIQFYIDRHLGEKLSLAVLGKHFGMSHVTLNVLFRKYLDVSPHAYIIQRRMTLAREMLRERNLSVKETADALGYSSPFNFSTLFRKHYGYPPGKKACLERL